MVDRTFLIRAGLLALALVLGLWGVAALAQQPPPAERTVVQVEDRSPRAGENIVLRGAGWEGDSSIAIAVAEFQYDGSTTAGPDGTFVLEIPVPAETAEGDTTIEVTGTGQDGEERTLTVDVSIEAASVPGGEGFDQGSPRGSWVIWIVAGIVVLIVVVLGFSSVLRRRTPRAEP
ncbi:MAG: hypothetical protein M3245_05080 [Actinomycetota bacterium]|nr:hypothetical protein [Actinomycetota bacterium]